MRVNIIIVNYNGWEDTVECLESVLKSNYVDYQVYVVDNSPDDNSLNKIIEWAEGNINHIRTQYEELIYPLSNKPVNYKYVKEINFHENLLQNKIVLIKASQNNGFAAANNIVLNYLLNFKQEELVFLLNNDTIIYPNTISNFVINLKNSKQKIIGGVLLEYFKKNIVQSVGGIYNSFFGITSQVLEGISLEDFRKMEQKVHIDYPVGASMFVSLKTIRTIGLLNENYFLYFEELDWIKRIEQDESSTYGSDCFILHKGGVSTGSINNSFIADKYSIFNRIKFAKKYNKSNINSVYLGVWLSILKRLVNLRFKRAFNLTREFLIDEI